MPRKRLLRGSSELLYWESPSGHVRNYSLGDRTFVAVRDAAGQPWLVCEMAVRKPGRPKEAVSFLPEKVPTVAIPAAIRNLMQVRSRT